jgi:hypothetical protein
LIDRAAVVEVAKLELREGNCVPKPELGHEFLKRRPS